MKRLFTLIALVLTISNNYAQLTITDNQAGDNSWRRINNGSYDIDFAVAGGKVISYFQTLVCSQPGGCTVPLQDWTTVVSGINANSYTINWALLSSTWSAMQEGLNYVSVRVFDNMGNSQTLNDVFYVKKDTYGPVISAVNDGPGVDIVYTNSDSQLQVNWDTPADPYSGVSTTYYAVGTTPGATDVKDWTVPVDVYPYPNNKLLITGLSLSNGITYYISIKATDSIGNITTKSSNGQTINSGNISAKSSNEQTLNNATKGGNLAGADWNITANCEISGVYTNINSFTIAPGVYVYVTPYNGSNYGTLEINAANISIDGTIDADSKGYRGGSSNGPGAPVGGSGGGYGGNGENSTWFGGTHIMLYGGQSFGTATGNDISMGSGGGGGANGEGPGGGKSGNNSYNASTGGRGGGCIKLVSSGGISLSSTGVLSTNGGESLTNGTRSGAGSGGGILIQSGTSTIINGIIRANGGGFSGGFGGAGGRVKIFGCKSINGTVTAAKGGNASDGTVNYIVIVMSKTDATCHGKNDGTATVTIVGCQSQYSFLWNTTPPRTTSTITGLAAGTYSVTVTDTNSFIEVGSVVITEPPIGNIIATNVTCHGGSDGTASASAVGCSPPNTYTWSTDPVQTTETASGLSAGTYTVTVTSDGNILPNIASVVITEPPIGNIIATNVTCYGGSDGTASASAVGCSEPKTYLWSTDPVQTTETITGLTAGTYTVTVTSNGNLLPNIATVVITQPPSNNINILTQPSDMSLCPNSGGSLSISVTGTSPLTYNWQYYNNGTWVDVADNIPIGASYSNLGSDVLNVLYSGEGVYNYRCIVSNICEIDTSETAVVTTISDGIWTGAEGYEWNNPGNWCSGTVPNSLTNVFIPGDAINMPYISTNDAVCASLVNYGYIYFDQEGVLNCGGNLTNYSNIYLSWYNILNCGGNLTNYSTINLSGYNILNCESVNNNSVINLYNNSNINCTGDFISNELYIDNSCNVKCEGDFANNMYLSLTYGAKLDCFGNIVNSGTGTIANSGGIINCGSDMINNAECNLSLTDCAIFNCQENFINSGYVYIDGYATFECFGDAVFNYPPTLYSGHLVVDGNVTGSIDNQYGVFINPGSIIGNSEMCEGTNNALQVNATGATATFQWQLSTDGGSSWSDILDGGVYSNVTTSTLDITNAGYDMNNNQYRCEIWCDSYSDNCPVFSKVLILEVGNVMPTASAGPDITICSGSISQLNASGGAEYSWSPALGLNATDISNPVASPNSTTTYTVTANNSGCTASDDVVINVNPVFLENNLQTICDGDSYTFNGHVYITTGNYSDTLHTVLGCDSIIVTQLTVNPTYSINNPQSICQGGSYSINGHTYTTADTYYDTFQSKYGCDSIVATQLTVNPTYSINNPQSICQGGSYSINGHTYTTADTYYDTFQSKYGCDSIVVTQLTVNPTYSINNPQSICQGGSYSINGHTYTIADTYYDTFQSKYGCDSIVATQLTVNPTYSINNPQSICQGGSYSINGHTYTIADTYYDTFQSKYGCDSIVATQLTVNPTYSTNNPQSICQGGSYSINGHTYTTADTYYDNFHSKYGCDSIVITQLTVNPTYSINNPQEICQGGSYSINGHTYTTADTYYDTFQSKYGCDSIVATQLTVNPTYSINNPQSICQGESYSINGHTYTTADTYYDTFHSKYGCDSIIVTQLTVNPTYSINNPQSICQGGSYSINGHTYTTADTYYDTFHSKYGCDSIVVTQLTVNPTYSINNPQSICQGGSYSINGHTYTTADTYYDTFHSKYGCDSIVATQLTVNPTYSINNPQSICQGGSYSINGHTYTTADTYYDTFQSKYGCDSIVVTQLTVNPTYSTNNPQSICQGGSYSINGHTYTTADTYYDTFQSKYGCDSIVATQLTVNPTYSTNNPQSICQGESYSINGHTYTTADTYYDTFHSKYGCDSTIVTQLIVNPLPLVDYSEISKFICLPHNPFTPGPVNPTGGTFSGTGVDMNIFYPANVGSGNYVITYTYTDENQCANSDTSLIIVDECTSVKESEHKMNLSIYPNPSNGKFYINYGDFDKKLVVKVLVINSIGAIILETDFPQTEIDLSSEPTGIYFLQIKTTEGLINKKLVLE